MNLALPLWDRVVFVDWNGVLSVDPFWVTILRRKQHELHAVLAPAVRAFFKERNDLVNEWMRGRISYKEVIATFELCLQGDVDVSYIERKLIQDCKRMAVAPKLLDLLMRLKQKAFVVIATDNMDCFYEQVLQLRLAKPTTRPVAKRRTLGNVARYFDDVVCSSVLGVMKREEPLRFFGPWLERHNLRFERALLIDDGATNCAAFENAGGAAIRLSKDDRSSGFERIESAVQHWMSGLVPTG
jgi:FMN phosphatase YigB (HAD superfamily)